MVRRNYTVGQTITIKGDTMKIIALSGYKGSGKDKVADYLIDVYGFKRYAFADTIKEMVSEQYNIPLNYFHDQQQKERALPQYPVDPQDAFSEMVTDFMDKELHPVPWDVRYWTPRALCILEGSVKRSVNSNYWVDIVIDQINSDKIKSEFTNVVITDLRYTSETNRLLKAFPDIEIVRIDRFDSVDCTDPSERDLDNYDFPTTLDNRGSLQDLYDNVDNFMETI